MGIGDTIFDFFTNLGPEWALIGLMLVFILDALMIPTVPEVMFVMFVAAKPTIEFGISSLIATSIGEIVGVFILYYIVKYIKVPEKIRKYANIYADFLIVGDERILFISRFAPMILFTGAFIYFMEPRWKKSKCVFWIVLGCFVKYGLVTIFCVWLGMAFDPRLSQKLMLAASIAMIIISFVFNFYRKKKKDARLKEAAALRESQSKDNIEESGDSE